MRKTTFILPVAGVVVGLALACAADPAASAAKALPSASPSPSPMLLGGYTRQDPQSDFIKQAAAKAIDLLRTRTGQPDLALVTIRSAETQVVAGLNYRLQMDVRTAKGPQTVTVVMYQDLKGGDELTTVEGL